MSVLQRKELEESPLADLHAIASELGIEGYRGLRKDDLIGAIVGAQGGEDDGGSADSSDDAEESPRPRRRRSRGRGRRASGAGADSGDDGSTEESSDDSPAEDDSDKDNSGKSDSRGRGSRKDRDDDEADDANGDAEPVTGILDILPNGSGFLRGAEDDVYVSQAQIKRCELRAGDEVGGGRRPARRNEKHPSLVRVEKVNGNDAEPPEQRPLFGDLAAQHPSERLTGLPGVLDPVPVGRGSRVAVAGAPGAGATRLLREIAGALRSAGDVTVGVALVGARPEEVTDWNAEEGVHVAGGSFDESNDAQVQAAELVVEQGKRVAERGGHAVVIIDSLESLPAGAARRLFGAARGLEGAGTLTVFAATGMAWEPQRQASTRIALDSPKADGTPVLAEARSGTLRADLLG